MRALHVRFVSDHADERWSTPTTPLLAYGVFTLRPRVTRADEAETDCHAGGRGSSPVAGSCAEAA